MLLDVKSFRSETIKLVVLVCLSKQIQAFFTFLSLISCVKFFPQMTSEENDYIYKRDAYLNSNQNDSKFPSLALSAVLREGLYLQ